MSGGIASTDPSGRTSSDALAALPRMQSLLSEISQQCLQASARVAVSGSTKTTVHWLRSQLSTALAVDSGVASIDAAMRNPIRALNSMLAQFGYDFASKNRNELLGMLRVFAMHQTDAGKRPVLIIRNAHRLSSDLIEILNEIDTIQTKRQAGIAILLFGDSNLLNWLNQLDIDGIEQYQLCHNVVEPLSAAEVVRYIKARCNFSLRDLPLLERIVKATDGRPERMDRLISAAWRQGEISAETLDTAIASPIVVDEPRAADEARLLISQSGKLLSEVDVIRQRTMIGRADYNDLVLDSPYVSRYQALLVKGPEDSDWIVDLNSRNGTFVNSRAVDYIALRHEDVVSLGNHRLKYVNPLATGQRPPRAAFAGNATAVFETLKADGGPDLSLLTQNLRKPG